jgi:hypothetical protein
LAAASLPGRAERGQQAARRRGAAGNTPGACLSIPIARPRDEFRHMGTILYSKSRFAKSTEDPGLGFVKEEITQEVAAPQGKITLSQTTKRLPKDNFLNSYGGK